MMGRATVEVPGFLKHVAGGATHVEVTCGVIADCVKQLISRFPEARPLLFDESGRLHRHIDIYVNGASSFPQELTKPVHDGDTISLVYLITGG